MAELADATDLKSVEGIPHGGSSPPGAIINTCSICLDCLDDNPKTLPCGHKFHEPCITRWCATRPNCPICRRGVSLGRRRRPAPITNRRVSRYAVIHRQVTNYTQEQRTRTNTNRHQNRRAMPRRGYRNQQSLPNLLV